MELSGSTDYEVIIELLKINKISVTEDKLREVLIKVDKEVQRLDLISELNLFPGVRNMLDKLSALEWSHGILTGNIHNRMISKLLSPL
jgi:phosphoglycolate phosphatase-like HAD superfamily hydrolase